VGLQSRRYRGVGGGLSGLPGNDGLDGEFRKRLKPGQHRERQALRDEKLRGFGGPRDQHCGDEHRRERPGSRTRAAEERQNAGDRLCDCFEYSEA